jgi:hypothetical protein
LGSEPELELASEPELELAWEWVSVAV